MKQKPKSNTWTAADSAAAGREGWNIFNEDTTAEIQRDDESSKFASDKAALEFVAGRMLSGSELHAKALRIVTKAAKLERAEDAKWEEAEAKKSAPKATQGQTPWRAALRHTNGAHIAYQVLDNSGRVVTECVYPEHAARIVRAVNFHERFRSALMSAEESLMLGGGTEQVQDARVIRDLLRAAGEEV